MSGEVDPKKKTLFLTGKYFEDAKQDEKHIPNLLESIMQPPGLVKGELRQRLFKIDQFGSKIQKITVQLFGFRKSKVFALQANASLLTSKF